MTLRQRIGLGVALGLALCAWGARHVRMRHLPHYIASEVSGAAGAFHVHSSASHDCKRGVAEIAAAARSDGLEFVVLADHNAQLESPVLIEGVTVLSYAELSTPYGHVIELGASKLLTQVERNRATVLPDLRARGAAPVVTHPFDLKQPWSGPFAGAAGIEIVNFAASSRRAGGRTYVRLLPTALAGLFNLDLALAQLYDRDVAALALWDREPDPRFVGLCGTDAHDWLDAAANLRVWTLILDENLPEEAGARPAAILSALLDARFSCSAGLLGRFGGLRFGAWRGGEQVAYTGSELPASAGVQLIAAAERLEGQPLDVVIFRDGEPIARGEGEARVAATMGGTYRAEAWALVPNLIAGSHLAPIAYSQKLRVQQRP